VDYEAQLEQIAEEIKTSIGEEYSVPRNIRAKAKSAVEDYLMKKSDDLDLRIYSTISILEEQIDDANIPQHARTKLYELIRDLESIVQKVKGSTGTLHSQPAILQHPIPRYTSSPSPIPTLRVHFTHYPLLSSYPFLPLEERPPPFAFGMVPLLGCVI